MYFIYDCNDKIIGNSKGYRTFRGAERQQDFNLRTLIWNTFDARSNKADSQVSSIKLRD
jgi:hypothetical protein